VVVTTLTAVLGDLLRQEVDALVNPTDTNVRGGGGLDAAIHAAGGPAILQECIARFPSGLAAGDAGWTTAGDLAARWVIHAVSPDYTAGQRDSSLLRDCYRRCLEVADEVGAGSIAFPLLGAGAHGWPRPVTIEAAIDAALDTSTRLEQVRLVAPDRAGYEQVRAALLLWCPPPVAEGTVGELFERAPVQFGLRGDAYLWRELRARFAATALPAGWFELRRLLVGAVAEVLDEPFAARESVGWHDSAAAVHVAAFDPGHGLSAGSVHVPWWSHTGIPLLLDRFEARRRPDESAPAD
jgi:O-acetyl-ADP-ribose deacetylase (regulator of RNase III)